MAIYIKNFTLIQFGLLAHMGIASGIFLQNAELH
jgi:hypothetical protein